MKNKKVLFGIVIFLFAITGIYSIQNVSAFTDTVYIPSSTYLYYSMGYLENGDAIEINEIDVDGGGINVYIMNKIQLETMLDSGGLTWNYIKRWQDTVLLTGWSIDIIGDGYYYVVLYNKDLLFSRTVYVDITIDYYDSIILTKEPKSGLSFLGWLIFVILPIIAGVVIAVILIRKHKRKIPEEVIKPEIIPIKAYCSECGTEILDKTRTFCSKCGTEITK